MKRLATQPVQQHAQANLQSTVGRAMLRARSDELVGTEAVIEVAPK
ncbi:MAG TPA: hypothetical protein VN017_00390 [Pseudoxanthomonas sp.]|nr:hypothetical protein [Pseudoxanthomonas sp.]